MFCPSCGTTNEDSAAYCLSCGRSMRGASPGPPAASRRVGLWVALSGGAALLIALLTIAAIFVLQPSPERAPAVVVFIAADGNVAIVHPADRAVTALTRDGTTAAVEYFLPRWSPDRRWLAVLRREGRQGFLWLRSADGRERMAIALDCAVSPAAGVHALAWAPDSRQIAWLCQEREGPALYRLTVGEDTPQVVVQGEEVRSVGWTGDGTRLAYTAYDPIEQRTSLVTVQPDGRRPQTVPVSSSEKAVALPLFSAQGGRLAYLAYAEDAQLYRLYVAAADGTKAVLVDEAAQAFMPLEWSPDGNLLLFYGGAWGRIYLYDVAADDYAEVPGRLDWSPQSGCTFLPDGQELACGTARGRVLLVDLRAEQTTRLATGGWWGLDLDAYAAIHPQVAAGLTLTGDYFQGSPHAPVTIYAWGSFVCPHCSAHVRETLPLLRENYIATGQVKYIYRSIIWNVEEPNQLLAAQSLYCAGDQDKFWEMHDWMYLNVERWGQERDIVGALLALAGPEVGLDAATFQSCLETGRYHEHVISLSNQALARQITAIPYYLVNDTPLIGFLDLDDFRRAIEAALESAPNW